MGTSQLIFDEPKHEYHVDGRRLLSVTQILDLAGAVDKTWYTPEACERGKLVHLACELADYGELDETTLDPAIRPYLDAWVRFLVESRAEVMQIEYRVCNETFGYAGTIDRWMKISGRNYIVDIKTGAPEPWHCLQTAAYARCIPAPFQRMTIYIGADGKYKADTHENPNDINAFLSALAWVNWKLNNGIGRKS